MIFIISSIGFYLSMYWKKKVDNSGGGTGMIGQYYSSRFLTILFGIGQVIGLYMLCD